MSDDYKKGRMDAVESILNLLRGVEHSLRGNEKAFIRWVIALIEEMEE